MEEILPNHIDNTDRHRVGAYLASLRDVEISP
jgi:hypothetical protein